MSTLDYVEAIEDGKIVKVTKEYANREGLFVLKKAIEELAPIQGFNKGPDRERSKTPLDLDRYRRPLSYKKNNVVADLTENFHWEVSRTRKLKGWTRRKLAQELGVSEEHVKMVENGLLPRDDFVLIAKLENVLGISLRKVQTDVSKESKSASQEVTDISEID